MTHTRPAYNVGRKVRDEMEYNRTFVALSADAAGYEFKGRKPAGRCVLETQHNTCKILVNVQDLRPMVRYGVYLIFADAQRYAGIHVGTLTVDEKGKADMRRELDTKQLHGYTPQNAAVVAVITTKGNHLESPLSGYPRETVAWRKTFYDITTQPLPKPAEAESKKNHDAIAPPESPPAAEQPPATEPPPQTTESNSPPIIEEAPPIIEETLPPPETASMPAPEPEPLVASITKLEPDDIFECKADEVPSAAIPPTPPPTIEEPTDIEFIPEPPRLPRKITPYITTDTFSALRSMTPFSLGDDDGVQWARFTADDCLPAPHGNVGFFDALFVVESYECYAHFILGEVTDREITGYVLGVPGVYDGEAALRAKELGLTEFRCYDPIPPTPGEFGYWLMGIV